MATDADARPAEPGDRIRLRPPDMFLANPPLAPYLADIAQRQATLLPGAETSALEGFDHLAGGRQDGPAWAPGDGSLDLVRRDAARLRRLIGHTAFARAVRDRAPVVYRLDSGGHSQTGVVVETSVVDYRHRRIRRHEAVDVERVRRVGQLLSATGLELVPVTLVHRTRPRLQTLLADVTTEQPERQLRSDDGQTQSVWLVREPGLAAAIWQELDGLESLYVADGHHRLAAAERHARLHCRDDGDRAACRVLSVLFPSEEVRVLGYHRCVTRPAGPAADLLETLAAQPVTDRVQECAPGEAPAPASGTMALWLDGRWYRVWLRPERGAAGTLPALDLAVLEQGILGPVFGAGSGRPLGVTPLPGSLDAASIAARCARQGTVGFVVHPPDVDQIMAVSDAGLVMPSKSTWFVPKAGPGLLVRDLRGSPSVAGRTSRDVGA